MPKRAELRQVNGPFRPGNLRQQVLFRDEAAVEHDLAGDRGAQADFAVDRRRGEALPALFEQEAADRAVFGLRPDQEHVGDRRVGDPGLGARQRIAALDLFRPRHHGAGVGAVVRLGEAEAADPLAGRELRQIFLLLAFRAKSLDRDHDQRRLHAHHRAVAGIDALHFARDQAIGDIAEARAAVFRRDRSGRESRDRPSRGRSPGRSSRGGRLRARASRAASCA